MDGAGTMNEEKGWKNMTNNEAALILMRAETIVFGVPEAEYIKAVEIAIDLLKREEYNPPIPQVQYEALAKLE